MQRPNPQDFDVSKFNQDRDKQVPTYPGQDPLPQRRPDDYEDDYLPGEESFGQRKNPIGVSKTHQASEARYENSGTVRG